MNRLGYHSVNRQSLSMLISLIFFIVFATPATAFASGTIGICARLPDRLTEEDSYWIRSRLDEAFALQQSALFKRVRIEEDQKDELLGPIFRDAGDGQFTLLLPQAYMRRLCHQILIQTVYTGKFDTFSDMNVDQVREMRSDVTAIIKKIGTCLTTLRSEPKCLDREILAYLGQGGAVNKRNEIDSDDENTLALVYGAAEFFIAHEATHAILNVTMSDSQLETFTEAKEEAQADLYALQHLFSEQNLPLAPMMVMATTSLIGRDSNEDEPHQADICRYQQIRKVFSQTAPALFKIANFMAKDQFFDDDLDITAFIKEVLDYPFMYATTNFEKCIDSNDLYINDAVSDLNRYFYPIFTRLNEIGIEQFDDFEDSDLKIGQFDLEKMVNNFEKRQWTTQVGKKIAAPYLYYLAVGIEFSGERSERLEEAATNEKTADAMREVGQALTSLARTYKRIGREWFSKETRVTLDIGIEGVRIKSDLSGLNGTAKQKVAFQNYNSAIDRVFAQNNFDLLAYYKALNYFNSLSKSLTLAYFPRNRSLREVVYDYTVRQIAFGSCREPIFLAGTLMGRIASQNPGTEKFNRAVCEEMKDEASEN